MRATRCGELAMNILIACECSGIIRAEFRKRGHNAYSCDLKPAEDGSPFHIQADALETIKRGCEIRAGVFKIRQLYRQCSILEWSLMASSLGTLIASVVALWRYH